MNTLMVINTLLVVVNPLLVGDFVSGDLVGSDFIVVTE